MVGLSFARAVSFFSGLLYNISSSVVHWGYLHTYMTYYWYRLFKQGFYGWFSSFFSPYSLLSPSYYYNLPFLLLPIILYFWFSGGQRAGVGYNVLVLVFKGRVGTVYGGMGRLLFVSCILCDWYLYNSSVFLLKYSG